MKKLSIMIICMVVLTAAVVWGSGRRGMDNIGQPVDQFFPTVQGSESKTKGTTTITTTTYHAVQFKTSAVANMTINGAGTSWPTVANTPETMYISPEVTSAVFSRISSNTPTVVYWRAMP